MFIESLVCEVIWVHLDGVDGFVCVGGERRHLAKAAKDVEAKQFPRSQQNFVVVDKGQFLRLLVAFKVVVERG